MTQMVSRSQAKEGTVAVKKLRVGAFPRLTPRQNKLVLRIKGCRHGDFYCSDGRDRQSMMTLLYHNMVTGSGTAWYNLTERGEDYADMLAIRASERNKKG